MSTEKPRIYSPQTAQQRVGLTRRSAPRRRVRSGTPASRANRPLRPAEVRRARRRTLLSLYGALGILCVTAVLTTPLLAVRRVKVTGTAGLLPQEADAILRAAMLPTGTNWLLAPVGKMEGKLRALGTVRDAKIARHFPNEVQAQVALRQPCALAQIGAVRYEVDADAVPIRVARSGSETNYPTIVLARPQSVRPGRTLDDAALRTSLAIVQQWQASASARIAKIEVDRNDNLCLNMQDGMKVVLGQADELSAQLTMLQRIYAREPDVAHCLLAINLSSPAWPACTPRPSPAQVPTDPNVPRLTTESSGSKP